MTNETTLGNKMTASDNGMRSPAGSANPSAELFTHRPRGREVVQTNQRPSINYWQDAWMRIKKNKIAMGAGAYVIALSLCAMVIPELLPYKYDEQEIWNAHLPPSLGFKALVVDEGTGDYTPIKTTPTEAGGFDIPQSPINVRALSSPLTTGVAIAWDKVEGADGYRIYRSISDDSLGVPVEDVGNDSLSYFDRSQLDANQDYYYFVAAFNAMGDSANPDYIKITPQRALALDDALKIDPNAKAGAWIQTNAHYLGTDYLGRDMFARVMMGARISLFIGFGAPLIYVLIGIIYGSISGYFGGLVDDIMMRVTDIVSTVPELLIVILLQVMMGSGVFTLLIALVAVAWARSARQIRGEILRLKEMEFVQASKVLGTPFPRIVSRHLLPNVMGTVLVVMTLAVPQAIFTEAFLSFIGLGISPPMASWGTVTKDGAKVFLTYPHELVIPSILISCTMLAFNLFGDGLRDALDPKLRGTT